MVVKKNQRGIKKPRTIAKIREYQREYHRSIRAEAVANGYCSVCAVEPASEGFATCVKCRERERARSAKRRETAKKKRVCSRCHVRPWTKGYKTCAQCREQNQ